MGQKISRRVMPRIAKATEKHEAALVKDAMDDIKRKRIEAMKTGSKYIDPTAQESGFTRGSNLVNPKENGQPREMPQDLINFLAENPLERRVDKDMTSKKVYESIKEDEGRREQQKQEAKLRQTRAMPIVENLDLDQVSDQGKREELKHLKEMTTKRTTNFSSTSSSSDDDEIGGLRFKDVDLFQFVKKLQANGIIAEKYISENTESYKIKEEEIQASIELIQNLQKYTGIPTIMEDIDKSVVGVWPDRVGQMQKLKLVDVEFCIENENIEK